MVEIKLLVMAVPQKVRMQITGTVSDERLTRPGMFTPAASG